MPLVVACFIILIQCIACEDSSLYTADINIGLVLLKRHEWEWRFFSLSIRFHYCFSFNLTFCHSNGPIKNAKEKEQQAIKTSSPPLVMWELYKLIW